MDNETPITRNVSLDEQTMAVVSELNDRLGLRNFSAALRIIVREWAESRSAQKPAAPRKTEKATA